MCRFSWQSSASLLLESFCTPMPKLSVIPGMSWLSTFAFHSSMKERIPFLFLDASSRWVCKSSYNCPTSATSVYSSGNRLGLLYYWMVCLGNKERSFLLHISWSVTFISSSAVEGHTSTQKNKTKQNKKHKKQPHTCRHKEMFKAQENRQTGTIGVSVAEEPVFQMKYRDFHFS